MSRAFVFTLKDRDGAAHTYTCTLHPATEGQKVMWALVAIASGPAAAALRGALPLFDLFKGKKVAEVLDDADLMVQVKGALSSLDFASLGESVRQALASAPAPELVDQILSRTLRDDKALDKRANFDAAFSGNYGELLLAVWEVCKGNRFLPLPGM